MVDYFSFYGLPVSFSPDPELVKRKFYEFSKKYHPDFFINESEEKQTEVLELSTINNKAYQVLSDPERRLHYILELKGLLTEGENYILPQSFLMDMMDINETLMDLQLEPDADIFFGLVKEIDVIEKSLSDELLLLTADFDVHSAEQQEKLLVLIKDIYYRNKYMQRIRESIKKVLS